MAAAPDDTPTQQAAGGHSPTLRELDQLPGLATIWYRLGLQLGVSADDLDMIEENYPRNTGMCKIKMFGAWLRGDTDPTYEKFVRALAVVGKRKLAESVCIVQDILLSVLDATDAKKMRLSRDILNEEEMESDAVTAAKTKIGYLQNEYEQLVIMTQEAVKAKSPTLTEFRTTITLRLPEPTKSELEISLTNKLQPIYDAKNIDTIFGILNLSIWSYLNFGLLQHLVEVYGDDKLLQRMLTYTSSVGSFRKETTLKVFWEASPAMRKYPEIPTELRDSLKQISFKHNNLDATTYLDAIESYRKEIAWQYSFPDFIIILKDIEKGCVATIWLVPPSLAAKLEDETKRGNVSFLEQHNILELKIEESTVYRSESAQTTDGTEGSVPEISFSDLEFGDELGEGAFGVVYRGHWKSRDMDVAIKRVPGKINKTEIEILNKLRHPCVIQLHGVVVDRPGPPEYYIITELAEGGSLYDLLHKKNYQPSQEENLQWAVQIAQGMKYLHQEKMMHRDLKSSNVLLSGEGNIKICDFGGAKYFDHTTKQTQTGTYRWMAPEVMKGEPVSLSSDVFSYGMLLYEILTGDLPFADAKTDVMVSSKILSGEVPPIAVSMEPYLAETLKQCWNANPKARPSFHEIQEVLIKRGCYYSKYDIAEVARDDSPEAKVFRKYFATLVSAIQDPESLADGFFSRNVIGMGLLQEVQLESLTKAKKNRKLLLAVTDQLVINPDKFTEVVEALQGDGTLESIVEKLKSDYLAATHTCKEDEKQKTLAGLQTRKTTTPLVPANAESQLLDPQCKSKWRRGADLPVAMSRPHLVKIRNNIYCGGGFTVDTERLVCKYDTTADTWSPLPPCPTYRHGLSELDNALVSVGGIMHNAPPGTPTNSVYKFQDPNWVTSVPPMPTARYDLSVFSHKTHLIACGGVISWTSNEQYTCTTTVEMLNSETGQWSTLAPLPFALCGISTAISNGRCYLIGGASREGITQRAYSAPLPLLIESASQPSPSSAVWEVLPNCPLYGSTAAELGGCVLALGGLAQASVGSTEVYLYSRNSKSWRRTTAVNLPIALYGATSATLAGDSIVVVGGQDKLKSRLNTVFIARLEN